MKNPKPHARRAFMLAMGVGVSLVLSGCVPTAEAKTDG